MGTGGKRAFHRVTKKSKRTENGRQEENIVAIERAKAYLKQFGADEKVLEFQVSSATVELAAQALGCEPERIAKSLTFSGEHPIMIVAAGDAKVDNKKFKEQFPMKAKMLGFDEVEALIGHAVGGVCPFGVEKDVEVYLDVSLKRFQTVFPAAGSANSAIELTIEELEKYSGYKQWVDVCKGWNAETE